MADIDLIAQGLAATNAALVEEFERNKQSFVTELRDAIGHTFALLQGLAPDIEAAEPPHRDAPLNPIDSLAYAKHFLLSARRLIAEDQFVAAIEAYGAASGIMMATGNWSHGMRQAINRNLPFV